MAVDCAPARRSGRRSRRRSFEAPCSRLRATSRSELRATPIRSTARSLHARARPAPVRAAAARLAQRAGQRPELGRAARPRRQRARRRRLLARADRARRPSAPRLGRPLHSPPRSAARNACTSSSASTTGSGQKRELEPLPWIAPTISSSGRLPRSSHRRGRSARVRRAGPHRPPMWMVRRRKRRGRDGTIGETARRARRKAPRERSDPPGRATCDAAYAQMSDRAGSRPFRCVGARGSA